MSFTEGYRLHLIRMNGEALHQKFVLAMRALEPKPRAVDISRAVGLCWSKAEHVHRCVARASQLVTDTARALGRVKRQEQIILQAKVLSVSVLEASMLRIAAKPKRRSVRKTVAACAGWSMARAAKPEGLA